MTDDRQKPYEPKKLSSRHYALMRELASGTAIGVALKLHGYSTSRGSVVINSPRFKAELEKMTQKINNISVEADGNRKSELVRAKHKLDLEIYKSLEKLVSLRDMGVSEAVQLKSATEILDRAGLNKIEKVQLEASMEVSESLVFALGLLEKKDDGAERKPDRVVEAETVG